MMKCRIDWLNFTYRPTVEFFESHNYDLVDCICDEIKGFEYILNECVNFDVEQHRNGRFYDDVIIFNDNVRLSFNHSSSADHERVRVQGLLFEVPSHGLEWFLKYLGCDDFSQVLSILFNSHCNITRIDIAYDDYDKFFKPVDFNLGFLNRMQGVFCANYVMITNFRKSKLVTSETNEGHTFYLGSRNTCLLRVYDKNYESGGAINAIRYEFEYHAELAQAIASHILDFKSVPSFRSAITRMFNLKSYNNQSTLSNLPDYDVWLDWLSKFDFCEEFVDFDITRYSKETKPIKALSWSMSSNVLNAAAKGYLLLGDQYFDIIREHRQFLRSEFRQLVSDFNEGWLYDWDDSRCPF